MFKPFSKRDKAAPDTLSYNIPPHVRSRIFQLFRRFGELPDRLDVHYMFEDAAKRALMEYGRLHQPPSGLKLSMEGIKHFEVCSNEQALDLLEWCFQSEGFRAGQQCVEGINEIFRDEGIGYEFSPYIVHSTPLPNGGVSCQVQFPEVVKKSNELIHGTTIVPTLDLLSKGKTFETANREILEAHQHFRQGQFTAAINSAAQALETVLKTICEKKRWPYQKDKDTLGRLLQTVQQKGLISDLYATAIQRTSGDVRNRLGAHGKGPEPIFATVEQAEHMIQVTSAHILLLVRTAKV